MFDDIIKLQLNTSFKYWRYLKNNDTAFLVNLFADYDSNNLNVFPSKLNSNSLKESQLAKVYRDDRVTQEQLDEFYLYCSLLWGEWHPNRHLSILGKHHLYAIQLGFKIKKIYCDIYADLIQGNSNTSIQFTDLGSDSILTSSKFNLEAILFNVGYQLYKSNKNEIIFQYGIGANRLTLFESSDPNLNQNNISRDFESFNTSFGIEFKRVIGKSFYFGLDSRYNINNITNIEGTNLSGNSFQLCLKLGFVISDSK